MSERIGDYIQVFSGGKLYPFDPRLDEIHIEDIAHALSRINRYTGHTKGEFGLSVAQHSVTVSETCAPEDALAGLLHDASDMAFNDIARPSKYMPEYSVIRSAETRFQDMVYKKFGLGPGKPKSVHKADNDVLAAEVRDLMTPDDEIWGRWLIGTEPIAIQIHAMPPRASELMFMARFKQLYKGNC